MKQRSVLRLLLLRQLTAAITTLLFLTAAATGCGGGEEVKEDEAPKEKPGEDEEEEEVEAVQEIAPEIGEACAGFCIKAMQCPETPDYADLQGCLTKCQHTIISLEAKHGAACKEAAVATYHCSGRNACDVFNEDVDEDHLCFAHFQQMVAMCPAIGAGVTRE